MKIAVLGLWHLGSVTAACLASAGHDVAGFDADPAVVAGLASGRPPIFEPGLEDRVREGLASGHLGFTIDVSAAVATAAVVWITCDTPVDEDDRADVEAVVETCRLAFPHLRDGALVLVSSQVSVGTTTRLEALFAAEAGGRRVAFAYSPENLRLGQALEVFSRPDRVIVGVRADADRPVLEALWRPFTDKIEWMSVESAEMTKHALNAFLATSVTFINEVAALCEQVGADAREVERGLKSEARIGPRAYLSPGGAIAGGTLARDVAFLSELGRAHDLATPLLSAIRPSNDAHRRWPERHLAGMLGDVAGRTVAVWGLTYKPGTDTLRRSSAIELCRWLHEHGAVVRAHDPVVTALPPDVSASVHLASSPIDAATGASAVVVATPWPVYRDVDASALAARMTRPLVLDAGGFLSGTLGRAAGFEYVRVGQGAA